MGSCRLTKEHYALRCLFRIRCHTGASLLLWHDTKGRIILNRKNLITLCRVAVLISLEIILTRFLSINTPTLRIGFGFIPIAMCGILYGPIWAGAAAGIADILGTFLSPYGIYPPITLTAILTGLSFGFFLQRKNSKNVNFFPYVLLCTLINTIGLSLFLQTYWLCLLQKAPYYTLLVSRLPQCAVLTVLYLTIIPLLQRLAVKLEHL